MDHVASPSVRRLGRAALLAVVALGTSATPARAQPFVALTGSGVFTADLPSTFGLAPGPFSFTFILPQSPTPSSASPDLFFRLLDVTGTFAQGSTTTSETGRLSFFPAANQGGFAFRVPNTGPLLLNATGPALFSGPTTTPAFTLGTYTGLVSDAGTTPFLTMTSVAITATPEPSSPALLGTGVALLALASFLRSRRPARRGST